VVVPDGLEPVGARDRVGPIPGLLQGGQQHGGENGDDGDDHQQLDQRETDETGAGLRDGHFRKYLLYCCFRTTLLYYTTKGRNLQPFSEKKAPEKMRKQAVRIDRGLFPGFVHRIGRFRFLRALCKRI